MIHHFRECFSIAPEWFSERIQLSFSVSLCGLNSCLFLVNVSTSHKQHLQVTGAALAGQKFDKMTCWKIAMIPFYWQWSSMETLGCMQLVGVSTDFCTCSIYDILLCKCCVLKAEPVNSNGVKPLKITHSFMSCFTVFFSLYVSNGLVLET